MAAVETLLRQTGHLGFRPDHEPTGYFSVAQDETTRDFQHRNGLEVDGIVNPDGETLRALEDESFGGEDGATRQREAVCMQNRVRLDNKQIEIDEATAEFEAASARIVALSDEADRLNSRNDLQLAIRVISGGVPAAPAIRAGLGIVAVLREFARGAVSDIPQLLGAQRDAEDLASRFEDAIKQFQRRHQHLQGLLTERRELLRARTEMGCA